MAQNRSTHDLQIQSRDLNADPFSLDQLAPNQATSQSLAAHQSWTPTVVNPTNANAHALQREKVVDLSNIPTTRQKRKLDQLADITPELYTRPLKHAKIYTQTDAQRALRRQGLKLHRVMEQMRARSERRGSLAAQIECLLDEMDRMDEEFKMFENAAEGLVDSIERLKETVEEESNGVRRSVGRESEETEADE